MEKKKKTARVVVISAAIVLTIGIIAVFAAQAGGSEDPLITLSYIDKILKPELMNYLDEAVKEVKNASSGSVQLQIEDFKKKMDEKVAEFEKNIGQAAASNADLKKMVEAAVEAKLGTIELPADTAGAEFKTVTVKANGVVTLFAGAELVLRSGGAAASSSGLVNATAGKAVASGGALSANNWYMAGGDGTKVKASAESVFLIRGKYTVQ